MNKKIYFIIAWILTTVSYINLLYLYIIAVINKIFYNKNYTVLLEFNRHGEALSEGILLIGFAPIVFIYSYDRIKELLK